MKIRIIGWNYEKIRKMGDTEIMLAGEGRDVYPVSMIMMPNGTGKTTTIKLLRGLLSGNAEKWDEKTVKSLKPLREDADRGKFKLKISFDNRIYYYILNLDYIEGKAFIQTSKADEAGGLEDGWQPPYELKGIMDNEEFVNRFIFDGEQAKKTLDAGNEEAEKAIINLYQINKLDLMISEIENIVKIKQENGIGKNTSRSIKRLQTKADTCEKKYNELCRKAEEIEKKLTNKKKQEEKYKKEYDEIIKQDKNFSQRKDRLNEMLNEAEAELSRIIRLVINSMQKVYNLHPVFNKKLKELVENMQVLKLPKSTAREFFNELASDNCCICGRPIGEEERKRILCNAEQYLGQEELVALNAIKSSLREYSASDEIKNNIAELKKMAEKKQGLIQQSRRLEAEIAESKGEEAAKIQETLREIKTEIDDLVIEQKRISTKETSSMSNLNNENNIYLAKKAREESKEQYLKAIGTYEFTQKAEKVKGYLYDIKESALIKLKEHVLEDTNQKISNIIKNDTIEVEKIDRHLVLKGRDAVSEGQTLAIAYAYIGSLFEHALFEFPFVVDSPAAAMDLDVRREVARVIQKLFGQLVIFVTSGEVKGFADTFYKNDNVQYLTISGGKEADVQCVSGKEFFNRYQAEEEE